MSQATICPKHGIIRDSERAAHNQQHRQAKDTRKTIEPWAWVYTTTAWRKARARAQKRDGHQCRVVEAGERCTATSPLEAHHLEPLRQLHATFDRAQLLREATNPDTIITVCAHHHRRLEKHANAF